MGIIGRRLNRFRITCEPKFCDLLDLEFRLNPKILTQVWKRFFEEKIKVKFSLYVDKEQVAVWRFENIFFTKKLICNTIPFSFTYEENTFILCDITEFNKNILFHFVRWTPKDQTKRLPQREKRREENFTWIFSMVDGYFVHSKYGKYTLQKKRVEFQLGGERISKLINITPSNCEMFASLIHRDNILPKKYLCDIL